MTRTLFSGGLVFDGTGAAPARADIAVEDGRIVELGSGLDGDDRIDLDGKAVLPGPFDCHVHVVVTDVDQWKTIQTPFSYVFYQAARNLEATLRAGITTVRDAGGADLGIKRAVDDGLISGPRMQISPSMISQTGGHGDPWNASGIPTPFFAPHPGVPETLVDGRDEMRRARRPGGRRRRPARCGDASESGPGGLSGRPPGALAAGRRRLTPVAESKRQPNRS